MAEPYLRTPRMRLRRVRAEDVELLVALNQDPEVLRYIDWRPPTREQVEAEIAGYLAGYAIQPEHGRFIAEDLDGEFLGWFGLTVGEDGTTAPDLGYRLRRNAWGRGLATEGGRALIDHAFTSLAAQRITAETMAVNRRSRAVMEKCGLRYAHTFHLHFDDPLPGTEHGEVRYEITRAQWRSALSAR